MNTITNFYASRTAARTAAIELNGKVKDEGKEAAPGKRWAVVYDAQEAVQAAPANPVVIHEPTAEELAKERALLMASIQKTAVQKVVNRRRSTVQYAINAKNKKVPVTIYSRQAA